MTRDETIERRLASAAIVAASLLFIPLLIPLVGGRVFVLDDLSSFHLPLRHVYQTALRAGHSVLWTSHLFGGFYIHAEGQIGALHPVHLLLYAALPLVVAFNVELILGYAFGFAGMWRFLKQVGFSSFACVVGAMAFAFSGFALLRLPHLNAITVIAHVPWLLYAIGLAVGDAAGERRRGLVMVALLVGSQVLLGYPQYVWMSALVCLLYGAVCGRARVFRCALAGLGMVAGLLLGGLQLFPTLDLLGNSMRANAGPEFSVSYSLHPLNLVQLVSPYLLLNRVYAAANERFIHEFGIYGGALATVALVWAAFRRSHLPFGRLAIFAAATSALGLLLALGRYGLLYEWLAMMPLLGSFRAPARHIMLVHFGFAVLVAILFEDLRQLSVTRSLARRAAWIWGPVLASGCAAAVAWWRPQVWGTLPGHTLYAGGMVFGVILMAVVTVLITDALRGSRVALTALPFVFALDLGLWGYPYVFAAGMQTVRELAARADPPPAGAGTTVHQAARTPGLNGLLLHDLKVLRPYVGLQPARVLRLTSDEELRVSGVQWVSGGAAWTPVAEPMPRIRFVPEWKVVDNPGALAGVDLRRTALVTEEIRATPGIQATATLLVDEPGHMLVEVSAPEPALLVTTEAYDRGWRATGPNAIPLETLPVYADYLGIVVLPGKYQLSLAFEPASLTLGGYASLAGLILTAVLSALTSTKPRNTPQDAVHARLH